MLLTFRPLLSRPKSHLRFNNSPTRPANKRKETPWGTGKPWGQLASPFAVRTRSRGWRAELHLNLDSSINLMVGVKCMVPLRR